MKPSIIYKIIISNYYLHMRQFWFFLLLILSPSLGVSEVGYKDLKIGMSWNSAEKICGEIPYDPFDEPNFGLCTKYSSRPFPKVQLGRNGYNCSTCTIVYISVRAGTYNALFEKLIASLSKKYGLPDYQFSEQEMELYNSGSLHKLYVTFAKGTVYLVINPKNEIVVNYATKANGKALLERLRKHSLNMDDF